MVQQLVHDLGAWSRPVLQVLLQRGADGIRLAVDEILYQGRLVEDRVEEGHRHGERRRLFGVLRPREVVETPAEFAHAHRTSPETGRP
ncbi:hypothetical protein [Actinoallomurus sp. CA-142502]|uniref:hypothetical protein n=1 Tax=Actinoallomurus sp. CA-142502 TaxID=3239885 RepID=UPI003D93B6B0